jgi:hypothetical protein
MIDLCPFSSIVIFWTVRRVVLYEAANFSLDHVPIFRIWNADRMLTVFQPSNKTIYKIYSPFRLTSS